MKINFFVLIFISFSVQVSAQLSRTHYIPPITAASNNNALPQNQYLHISTPSMSTINVEINQLGVGVSNFSLSNSSPLEIFIGNGNDTSFVLPLSNTLVQASDKGYVIQSEKPVYASVRLTAGNQNQAGSLVSKGLSGLGKIFRVGTFTNLKNFTSSNQDYVNFVSVMATENNTQINFSDIPGDVIVENNTPLSANLDAGESYVLALNPAITQSNRDGLIGALVTSNKPIVVNCGSLNGSNSNGGGRDAGIDQIAPLQTISIEGQDFSEYIFVRANGYDDIERPLIIAHYDNTEVWINGDSTTGSLLAILNSGEYISIDGDNFSTQSISGSNPGGNLYVWTSKTTFAYQGIGGTNNEANQEMFFVPPLNCKAPRRIDNIPLIQSSGSGDVTFIGGITIVAETDASIQINGVPTTASPQSVLGNSNYETYLISGLTGDISVSSDGQIYVSYYGANGAAALGGFYSGFIFKPEITPDGLSIDTEELCIPYIELSLSSEETFDGYQWIFNGDPIQGATFDSYIPTTPGYYQLEGIIFDCSTVISDNVPVSGCVGDYDGDGINNNLDLDLDNDGILNVQESNCNLSYDLSNSNGPNFTSEVFFSESNTVAEPFVGFSDQTMVLKASPTVGTISSSAAFQLVFDSATQFKLEQAPSSQIIGQMDDTEEYVFSVPFDQTITIHDPDNQLLIDVNYDGVYDNNINEFTAFEIRFKLNSAAILNGEGTFSIQSHNATQFKINYINNSDSNINDVSFQLTQACKFIDSDLDSITDIFDLDSDNDGVYDIIESSNGSLDIDQDGRVDDLISNDTNLDGYHDNAINPIDSDLDLVFDFLDLDSDNDGLYDLFEAGIGFNTLDLDNNGQIDLGFVDLNNNGASDVSEAIVPIDSDLNGIPDFIQLDSDADGCFDVDEAGFEGFQGILNGTGIDLNGLVIGGNGYNQAIDTNSDGLYDYQDYVEIVPIISVSPEYVCESDSINLEINFEPNSDEFDMISWEFSSDGGISWNDILESTPGFQGVFTSTLIIASVQTELSNTFFRAKMTRDDLICQSIFSTPIQLVVNPLPVVQSYVSLFQCDQDTDGITTFNLNEANSLISSNHLDESFFYYHNLIDAENGDSNFIVDPVSYQNLNSDTSINPNIIFVRVETQSGCFMVSELELFVSTTQIPDDFSINPYKKCYDDSTGITVFDFSDSETMILELFPSDQSLSVSYYESETDALSEINSIQNINSYENDTGEDQVIWVRIDSDIDNSCIGMGSLIDLIIEPLPVLNNPINTYFCIEAGEVSNIDLDIEFTDEILGEQLPDFFSVEYFLSNSDAESGISTISNISSITGLQTIFYKITNNSSYCYDIGEFNIQFINIPTANTVSSYEVCDNNNDGLFTFDTSSLETSILAGQTNVSVEYTDAFGNPLQDANGVLITSPFPEIFYTTSQTITATVFNGFCDDDETQVQFIVNSNTDFSVEDVVICGGDSELIQLDLQSSTTNYQYVWDLPDSSIVETSQPELWVNQLGLYQVTVSNLNGSCSFSQFFEVFESDGPTISMDDIIIVEATSNNSIFINETSLGSSNYEFQLIDENGNILGPYQDQGYFDQLTGGFYNLYVRDELQCEEISIVIPVIYIPNFFTPNNDGYNDVWEIKGVVSGDYIFSSISIFNRFGKLLKNMSLNQNFWDGTYNGIKLPTNDYWYRIELVRSDNTVLSRTGHFTLRR